MTTLTCPKCRQGLPDDALDAGQCHLCGFPLDGPVVLGTHDTSAGGTRLLLAAGGAVLVVAVVAGFVYYDRADASRTQPATELAALTSPEPASPVRHVAGSKSFG